MPFKESASDVLLGKTKVNWILVNTVFHVKNSVLLDAAASCSETQMVGIEFILFFTLAFNILHCLS